MLFGEQMENIEWEDDFYTGIEEIDNQHKNIVGAINALCHSVYRGHARDIIKDSLVDLDSYMNLHFETEENYMVKYNFQNILAHKDAHEYFRKTYEQIRYSYFYVDKKNLPRPEVVNTYAFHLCMVLTNWIKIHFPTLDREFVEFLKEKLKEE